MTDSTHLALPFLDAAQAQKHVTLNEALALLDALVHLSVSTRVSAPPSSAIEGDRVLVGPGATDAFAGKDNKVAAFLAGSWSFLTPQLGWRLHIAAESQLLIFDGADWVDLGLTIRDLPNVMRVGVGTSADASTPLAAKLNGALFAAKYADEGGNGDLRFTLNKEAAGKTVSQLYQSNWSGCAETGLTGDDNFHIKVSADGANWRESLVIDRMTGAVSLPSGGPTTIVTFSSSGVYTPSPGMTFVEVILFGGGGGGGSGACQAAGVAASGGGGGGGGGVARGLFPASRVGATQNITIAAGGAGGAAQTANSAAGLAGGQAGDTSFGNLLKAFGGGGGAGGGLAVASGGGGGGSALTRGNSSAGATGGQGSLLLGSGGTGASGVLAQAPGFGGGGGGAPATGGAGADGGGACSSASGGGAGGGLTNAKAASNGGRGGVFFPGGLDMRGALGSANGAISGGAGPGRFASATGSLTQAGGGGGGGASGIVTSGAGGPGGFPGGGGGGGAHQNGGTGGAGGPGGAGYAVIIEHF